MLIEPVGRKGALNVTVTLASYCLEERHRLTTHFRTGYAELQAFARSLKLMANKQADEAVLTGS